MGSKYKTPFLGPLKGTSLHETTSFDILIVKIGAGVCFREEEEPEKLTSQVTLYALQVATRGTCIDRG